MCGIVGTIGRGERAMDVLIDGLRRLEYRGYDSAGVAIFDDGSIEVRRAPSRSRERSASGTPAGRPTESRPCATPIPTAPDPW
jgi:glucosamine--fructose-6-phosphate aminotransferase (isomerizing)